MSSRAVVVVTVFLTACGAPPTERTFVRNVPPSTWNGVWQVVGSPQPQGLIIFETVAGTRFSPHSLFLPTPQILLTHACADFEVDEATGNVVVVTGANPGGMVQGTSPDFAVLAWDTRGVSTALVGNTGGTEVTIDASLTRSGASLTLDMSVDYRRATADGGTAQEVFSTDELHMKVERVSACP